VKANLTGMEPTVFANPGYHEAPLSQISQFFQRKYLTYNRSFGPH